MKVYIEKDYDAMSKKAFEVIKEVVVNNPNAILGLATGSSPIGTYKNLVEDYKTSGTSYKTVSSVNLDEYVGLGEGDEQSYVTFMRENFFNHVIPICQTARQPTFKQNAIDTTHYLQKCHKICNF